MFQIIIVTEKLKITDVVMTLAHLLVAKKLMKYASMLDLHVIWGASVRADSSVIQAANVFHKKNVMHL